MATYLVNNVSALQRVIAGANNGDVIKLASGNYSNVLIRDVQINGNITITSADSSNPAVLKDLVLRNTSGFTFTGLELAGTTSGHQYAFQIASSSNITMDNLDVYGQNNLGSGNETPLMFIRDSQNVTVTNSEFSLGQFGIGMLNTNGVSISGNFFHDLRTDGVRGGGNSDLTVHDNLFTDFYPIGNDHPDAIQLWTTNASTVARNITITENMFVRGAGQEVQGIFIRDTYNNLPFDTLNISGNMIAGGRYNGLTINGAKNVTLDGNTVQGFSDQRSWLRLDNVTSVKATNNEATFFVTKGLTVEGVSGNTLIPAVSDGGAQAVAVWLNAHPGFDGEWGNLSSDVIALLNFSGTSGSVDTGNVSSPSSGGSTSSGSDDDAASGGNTSSGGSTTTDGDTGTTAPPPPSSSNLIDVIGTSSNDRLAVSNAGSSKVQGLAGNDVLKGGSGNYNELLGGRGNDVYLISSNGDKVIENAGEGRDTVRATVNYTMDANVEVLRMDKGGLTGQGNALDNRMIGSNGADTMHGNDGDDAIQGENGNDVLTGGNGDDWLRGGDGNDSLDGGAGNDRVYGDDGDDILQGGSGDDIVEGGLGADILYGGSGADAFLFRPEDITDGAVDTIKDFQVGVDRIALSTIDADSTNRGNDTFNFIGKSGFHNQAGELRYDVVAGNAYVQIDTNGDGRADMTVIVEGVTSLNIGDFVL